MPTLSLSLMFDYLLLSLVLHADSITFHYYELIAQPREGSYAAFRSAVTKPDTANYKLLPPRNKWCQA